MPATPADVTLQQILNKANLNQLGTLLQKMKLGNMLNPVKVTVAGLAAAAAVDITTAAVRAAATISGLDRDSGDNLPAILSVTALRVTAVGTGALGARIVTDTGGTPGAPGANGPGIATISDDGKTLTFEGTVTGFVLEYIPRSYTDLEDSWVSGV